MLTAQEMVLKLRDEFVLVLRLAQSPGPITIVNDGNRRVGVREAIRIECEATLAAIDRWRSS